MMQAGDLFLGIFSVFDKKDGDKGQRIDLYATGRKD